MTPARWGGFAVAALAVLVVLTTIYVTEQSGPCAQAQQAQTIALTSPNPQDRSAALTLYYLNKAECEAAGGTFGK